MTISTDTNTITLTDGSAASRLGPQHIIDNTTDATLHGEKTIRLAKNLVIDGFYEDTGWHYEFSDGSRFHKNSNCNWVSGLDFHGFRINGFTASIDNLGHSNPFNLGNGGSVTWRNVRIETRSSLRSDFDITNDTSTDYDIDGLEFVSNLGSGENNRLDFDVGTIRNVTLPRCNFRSGGTGTLENVRFSGLQESGVENKIFPVDNNTEFVNLEPYIESDGKRLATGFHTFTGTNKIIYFDDLIVPDYWDHTTDVIAYQGPGHIIARRTFKLLAKQGSTNLSDVRVYVENDNDESESYNNVTDVNGEIEEKLVVYDGEKTNSNNSYQIPQTIDDYQEKSIRLRRMDLNEVNFTADMSAQGVDTVQFFSIDTAYDDTIGTISGIAISGTTITLSSDNDLQKLYNYIKEWLVMEDNINVDNFVAKNGTEINIGSYDLIVDSGVTLSSTDVFKSISTDGTITNNGTIEAGFADSTGVNLTVKTNPPESLVRLEEYDSTGTTLNNTFTGISGDADSLGAYYKKLPADAIIRIYLKKWGYFFTRVDHNMADGLELDTVLTPIAHIDVESDLTAYNDESDSGITDRIYFDYDTTNNKGNWTCGEMNTSGRYIRTAALLDHRISTQDGLAFYAWFNVQTGVDVYLGGRPYTWNHDRLEINEDHVQFIRISGMSGTEISRIGVPVKSKDELTDYIAPESENSRVGFDNVAILIPVSTLEEIVDDTVQGIERNDGPLDQIKAKTDGLNFLGDDVKSTLDEELVHISQTYFNVLDRDQKRVYVYGIDKKRNPTLDWDLHGDHEDTEGLVFWRNRWRGINQLSGSQASVISYTINGVRVPSEEFDLPASLTDVQGCFIKNDDLWTFDNGTKYIEHFNLVRRSKLSTLIDASSYVENGLGLDGYADRFYVADARTDSTDTRKIIVMNSDGTHNTTASFDLPASCQRPTGVAVTARRIWVLDELSRRIFSLNHDGTNNSSEDITLDVLNTTARSVAISQGVDVASATHEILTQLDSDVTEIKKYHTNRRKVDATANTISVYDDDGTTTISVKDLTDENGNASTDNAVEETPQ